MCPNQRAELDVPPPPPNVHFQPSKLTTTPAYHNPCFDLVATTDSYNKEASRTFPLNDVGKAAAI
jgi:hypothetical protein